ncbi:kinase-like domain-containing protein [Hyaloraphidium curvatum]|nr:kinase-like domain-containing protein [Hyaloraphidium curvatum]
MEPPSDSAVVIAWPPPGAAGAAGAAPRGGPHKSVSVQSGGSSEDDRTLHATPSDYVPAHLAAGKGPAPAIPPAAAPAPASPAPAANTPRGAERRFGPYLLARTLGEGQFGKVKLALLPTEARHVAIKLVRKDSIVRDPVRRSKLAREIALLRRVCDHPNVVSLEQVIETERYVGIVMEYAEGGELFDRILTSKYLKPDEARWFFTQLLDAVQHLHRKGIVHRDLKLENLLITWDRPTENSGKENLPPAGAPGARNPAGYTHERIVLTDFGFATTIVTDQPPPAALSDPPSSPGTPPPILAPPPEIPHRLLQTSCGSPCYAAPELVLGDAEGKGYDGIKADLWSCGVILYAMCAGYLPFDDDPNNPQSADIQLLYKHIMSSQLTYPKHVPVAIREVVEGMLRRDPRQRWGWAEVRANEWVKTGSLATAVSVVAKAERRIEEKLAAAVQAAGVGRRGIVDPHAAPRSPVDEAGSEKPALAATPAQPAIPTARTVQEVALPPAIESGVIKALATDLAVASTTPIDVMSPTTLVPEPEASRTANLTFSRRFAAPWRTSDESAFGRGPDGSRRRAFGSRGSVASSARSGRSAISAASSRMSAAAKSAFSSAGRSIAALLRISRPQAAPAGNESPSFGFSGLYGDRNASRAPVEVDGDEGIEERDAAVADVQLSFDDDSAGPVPEPPPHDPRLHRGPDLIVEPADASEVRMAVEAAMRGMDGAEWRGWGSGGAASWTCQSRFAGSAAPSVARGSPPVARKPGFFGRLLSRGAKSPSGGSSASLAAVAMVNMEVSVVGLPDGGLGILVRRALDDALGEDVFAWTARKRTAVDALRTALGARSGTSTPQEPPPPLVLRGGQFLE